MDQNFSDRQNEINHGVSCFLLLSYLLIFLSGMIEVQTCNCGNRMLNEESHSLLECSLYQE